MAARGRIPTTLEGRLIEARGIVRHGTVPGLSPVVAGRRPLEITHHPELLETKVAAQAAEIKQLVGDNQRLASTHVILREELVATQQEVDRLKAHMRSIQTESDIQIRVLVDKIARVEADIRAREAVEKDLQDAHKEAQSLVAARREMTLQIQEATKERQKACADVKSLPDLQAEVESLKKEHKRLRTTFEYEKGLNIEQVEELQAMEKKVISMAGEVEKLKIDVFNAEKRAHVPSPYAGGYMNPDFPYRPPMQGNVTYVDSYGRPHVQMGVWPAGERMIGSSGVMAVPGAAFPPTGVSTVPSSGVAPVPSGGVSSVPSSGVAAVPTSGCAIIASNEGVAAPGSAGASGSTSGGDAGSAQARG